MSTTKRKPPVEIAPHLRGQQHQESSLASASSRATEGAAECVRDYPITSAIATLAAGIGVGFCLGVMLRGSSWNQSQENLATRLGHRMMDTMSGVMPDKIFKS